MAFENAIRGDMFKQVYRLVFLFLCRSRTGMVVDRPDRGHFVAIVGEACLHD